MIFCDRNNSVIEWGSEEVVIPYRSPVDGRVHRYYVDFYIKVRTKTNEIKKYLVEIKPKNQTSPPPPAKKQTKLYKDKVLTFLKNQAKWEAQVTGVRIDRCSSLFSPKITWGYSAWQKDSKKNQKENQKDIKHYLKE